MNTGVLGEIRLFAGENIPKGWLFCDGEMALYIDYPELGLLLGTTFGGDGRTTFGLPDLRGRVMVGTGEKNHSGTFPFAQSAGSETTSLNDFHMISHSHPATWEMKGATITSLNVSGTSTIDPIAINDAGNLTDPTSAYPAAHIPQVDQPFSSTNEEKVSMAPTKATFTGHFETYEMTVQGNATVTQTGFAKPFSIVQPFLGLVYMINAEGQQLTSESD